MLASPPHRFDGDHDGIGCEWYTPRDGPRRRR
ncbi:MAG: excalibur calcium-binding domain-containing protein [Sandaracinaceae bacterium]